MRPMICARHPLGLCLVALTLWWSTIPPADAANLYRYRNDQGILVIDNSVPADAASRGYEIISRDGKVIETVSPAGPPAAADAEPVNTSPQRSAEQDRLDRYLLTSYSSVADIEAVKARRLEEVGREAKISQTRFDELSRRRLQLEDEAANLQRGGKAIPESLLSELGLVTAQIDTAHGQIEERQLQRAELEAHYDAYLRRFRELKAPQDVAEAPPATPEPATPIAPATAP